MIPNFDLSLNRSLFATLRTFTHRDSLKSKIRILESAWTKNRTLGSKNRKAFQPLFHYRPLFQYEQDILISIFRHNTQRATLCETTFSFMASGPKSPEHVRFGLVPLLYWELFYTDRLLLKFDPLTKHLSPPFQKGTLTKWHDCRANPLPLQHLEAGQHRKAVPLPA